MIRRCIIHLTKKLKVSNEEELTDAGEEMKLDNNLSPSDEDHEAVSVHVHRKD